MRRSFVRLELDSFLVILCCSYVETTCMCKILVCNFDLARAHKCRGIAPSIPCPWCVHIHRGNADADGTLQQSKPPITDGAGFDCCGFVIRLNKWEAKTRDETCQQTPPFPRTGHANNNKSIFTEPRPAVKVLRGRRHFTGLSERAAASRGAGISCWKKRGELAQYWAPFLFFPLQI